MIILSVGHAVRVVRLRDLRIAAPSITLGPDLIQQHVVIRPLSLVPEIRLHTTCDFGLLWEEYSRNEVTDEQLPFWAVAWAGGQAIARYLLDHPHLVRGRTVLDLGAGSGICGIAAALAGAATVRCADVDKWARQVVALNAVTNHVTVEIAGDDLLDANPPDLDVFLVGDMFYERELAERLLPWLFRAVTAGCTVLVGDPGRPYTPLPALDCLAEYAISGLGNVEGADTQKSCVYAFGHDPHVGPI